jgi:hypothetical protein
MATRSARTHLAGFTARDALALVSPRPDPARLIELIDIPP